VVLLLINVEFMTYVL